MQWKISSYSSTWSENIILNMTWHLLYVRSTLDSTMDLGCFVNFYFYFLIKTFTRLQWHPHHNLGIGHHSASVKEEYLLWLLSASGYDPNLILIGKKSTNLDDITGSFAHRCCLFKTLNPSCQCVNRAINILAGPWEETFTRASMTEIRENGLLHVPWFWDPRPCVWTWCVENGRPHFHQSTPGQEWLQT